MNSVLVSELHVLDVNNTNVITMSFPPLVNRTLIRDIKEANEQFYSGVVIGVLSSGEAAGWHSSRTSAKCCVS